MTTKKKKKASASIIINEKKSWFEKCLDRIEAGKSPFPKTKTK